MDPLEHILNESVMKENCSSVSTKKAHDAYENTKIEEHTSTGKTW